MKNHKRCFEKPPLKETLKRVLTENPLGLPPRDNRENPLKTL